MRNGLNPDRDVTFLAIGGTRHEARHCSAAPSMLRWWLRRIITRSSAKATDGCSWLGLRNYPLSGVAASADFLAKKSGCRFFSKGLMEGAMFIAGKQE